jgi:LPS export ABC transporter protein LptC
MFLLLCSLAACSFDYGATGEEDTTLPDMVMNDVEYVRVRDGDPQVRFRAERAERYEDKQLMDLRNFTFEQFTQHDGEIDTTGRARSARVELDSGNIGIFDGVSLSVDSEDITIETESLNWQDKERQLSGDPEAEVRILRDDGTNFQGRGFTANTRSRRWEFAGPIGGVYVHEDDDDETDEEGESEDGPRDGAEPGGEGESP